LALNSRPRSLQVKGTDDSNLIALGSQFEEIAANVKKLQNSASPTDHLELEAMLGRLEPIELAIMATPAQSVAGLGVKARHAAYAMSEYWNAPIQIVGMIGPSSLDRSSMQKCWRIVAIL
jgi:hypothetical protein